MTLVSLTGLLRVAAPAAILVPLAVGSAQADTFYDTTRVLPERGNACLNPANCKVIEGDRTVIRQGAAAIVTMRCPAARPYFQGWDVRRHEHITVHLLDYNRKWLKVIATNDADSNGVLKVFLGCSAKDIKPTSLMESAGGFPTKRVKKN